VSGLETQLLKENESLKASLLEKERELQQQQAQLTQLRHQIDWLRKKLFGTGKSEKLDPRQRELLLGELEKAEKQLEETVTIPEHQRKKRGSKKTREETYDHLPVSDVQEIIPPEVEANPEAYERTGAAEETFELVFHPPKVSRRKTVRPKFRFKADRSHPLVVAPAKPRVVEGLASASLLAYIMVSKFVDHLPLYRQAKMFKRLNCPLSESSMGRWVEKVANWLEPVYDFMLWELLQGNYLQVDETPIQFCDPDLGLKKTAMGYFCAVSKPDANIVFLWRRGRSTAEVTDHLQGFKGLLQSDAYAAYLKFDSEHTDVSLLGCMAHARRKFDEAIKTNRRESLIVLKLIARLYAVEKDIRESDKKLNAEKISAIRKSKSTNTLKRLHRALVAIEKRCRPTEPVRIATGYTLKNWEALTRYLKHGHVSIDNNLIENAIRPTAVGKKNWLFIGHPNAGNRSAILYSLLVSCERFGVNPTEYVEFVLEQPIAKLSRDELAKLTPKAFAERTTPRANVA